MRIKALRQQQGLLQKDLARQLGMGLSTLSQYESGNRQPDYDTLIRIADFFSVTLDFLLERDAPPEDTSTDRGMWISVLGDVAAGIPIEAVEEITDLEEISGEMAIGGEYFALRLKGDSMEPRMLEGDVVIVRRQQHVATGDIAVVLVGSNTATVKKTRKRPEGILLIPFNPTYEPILYTNSDIARLPVSILGKVVELRAKL